MKTNWTQRDFDAVKKFKESKENGVRGVGFKTTQQFINSLE